MRRLYKELENYGKSDFYPFHMPGHKRNKACIEGDFPIERDITEIDGFDDLHPVSYTHLTLPTIA